ncbi:MAG: hypothetical protein LBH30_01760 [Prevotellaceae bacterium]|jgi:hypothetical protein|nr:hypothetical protein [Prevotellaceae bacterium]
MKKSIAIFIFIVMVNKIFAQTETDMQKLSLPDTSKSVLNVKPMYFNNANHNIIQNPYPAILTIEHEDIYLSSEDLTKHDSLDLSNMQKDNPDLLFVRSAYFSTNSKLTVSQKQNPYSFTDAEWAEKLSLQIAKTYREKYGYREEKPLKIPFLKFRIGSVTIGISFVGIVVGFTSWEEYMKARAEKRKKAYMYYVIDDL